MKNVVIARAMQFKLDPDDKPKGQGDPAVIPDAVYDAHPDWFQVIEDDLDELTVDELKDRLRDLELAVSGNKADLIARLRDA